MNLIIGAHNEKVSGGVTVRWISWLCRFLFIFFFRESRELFNFFHNFTNLS